MAGWFDLYFRHNGRVYHHYRVVLHPDDGEILLEDMRVLPGRDQETTAATAATAVKRQKKQPIIIFLKLVRVLV